MEYDELYKRGEIIYVNLSPVIGSEQDGIRPALIVQNDKGNKFSPTLIILPITSRIKKILPTHIRIDGNRFGLPKDSVILGEQIRTIDKKRILSRIGFLDEITMLKVKRALEINFEIRSDIFALIDNLD